MDISVVIPVYGCKAALYELHFRLCKTLEDLVDSFEIVLVDDCCPQNSWEVIKEICKKDPRVIGIHLSRNFGQIRAITAGLDHCHGKWVVVMDCDLQDRPEFINTLFNKAQEGYDVVFARRIERKDSIVTKSLSKLFYKVYNYFTDGAFDNAICNYSISKRIVIDNYCKMREQGRAYTLFIKWLGFKQATIDAEGDKRFEGESSYNLKRKMIMAFEIITAQSNKPLKISASFGIIIALFSFLYMISLIFKYIRGTEVPVGWTTIVASIYLMGGLLMFAIGVLGCYVGNIFDEVKNRPLYVISEIINYGGGRL